MDRIALRHATVTVARTLGAALAFGVTLSAAIWIPTLALRDFAGLPFFDAYMLGCPLGIILVTLCAIGVMTYRGNVRKP